MRSIDSAKELFGGFRRGLCARSVGPSITREFLRYFLVSAFALLADTGVLLLLSAVLHYLLAATISFCIGAVVHYMLSLIFVFRRRRLERRQGLEFLLYLAGGVLALLVNLAVIAGGVELFSLSLLMAKLIAAVSSFLCGFVFRKALLF